MGKHRYRNSYVDRTRSVSNTGNIGPVEPVNRVENNVGYSSVNHLIASDEFYDKLEKLTEEYRKFYHHERNLEKAIKNIEENKEWALENMRELIDKYNKAIIALEKFDKHLHTDHAVRINNIILDFEKDLNNIGIEKNREKELNINETIFMNNMSNLDKERMKELLKPIRIMIKRLYKGFKSIKGPGKEYFDREYDSMESIDYSGLILNEKS